jgi:hypothetical protein
MKQTIGFNQFHDAFRDMGRLDNFSYDGLRVLYDWFEELDADCGTETELDVIAFCCEFSEATPDEIRSDYDTDLRGSDLLDWLNERTMVCGETADTIVYAAF